MRSMDGSKSNKRVWCAGAAFQNGPEILATKCKLQIENSVHQTELLEITLAVICIVNTQHQGEEYTIRVDS